MGITIPRARLLSVLEEAVMLAESDDPLPEEWLRRVRRIAGCPSKSYIAAFGTALLAKAADERIDALAVKASAGSKAYSMRGVVQVLVERAGHYGYHLGATRREPLNNQPWFRMSRVDDPVSIKANARAHHRDLIRYLNDLNALSSEEALLALAAFLRARISWATEQHAARPALPLRPPVRFGKLVSTIEHFIRDDPEGGRRGQALVAAVLDLLHDQVGLAAINDPTALDVRVLRKSETILGVEVKQKPVAEDEALELAEGAAGEGVDKALLVALADAQQPLRHERIRREAEERHGVLAVAYESVSDLLGHAATHSRLPASEFASALPEAFLRRMQEHGVSVEGQQHWVDVCAGLEA